jgi:hypothetical protein
VFITNQSPQAVLDPSSLRRIGYKVYVGPIGATAYRALFRQQCHAFGMAADEAALAYLIDELHRGSGQPLLAGAPRAILARIAEFAAFLGQPAVLSPATIDQAWTSMFADAGLLLAADTDASLFARIE